MPWNQGSGGGGGGGGGAPSGPAGGDFTGSYPNPQLGDIQQTDRFTPTNGQTVFVLAQIPMDPEDVEVSVNGLVQEYMTEYTLSGSTLTWLNNNFPLTTTDRLRVTYNY